MAGSPGAPSIRFGHATAFDRIRNETVVFSGGGANDTWVFPGCPTDSDGDGVRDNADNRPSVANANRSNIDRDAFGDVCDQCLFDPTNATNAEGQCIPTLSEWGMMAMAGLVLLVGGVVMKRWALGIRQ